MDGTHSCNHNIAMRFDNCQPHFEQRTDFSMKKLNFILPLPFNNSILPAPVDLELQTISSQVSTKPIEAPPPTLPHNFTFTTGLITILINIGSVIITTAIAAIFSFNVVDNDSWLIACNLIDIIFTTLIPLYWILANEELRDFCSRYLKSNF